MTSQSSNKKLVVSCHFVHMWTYKIRISTQVPERIVYSRCRRTIACVILDGLKLINETNLVNFFINVAEYSCIADRGNEF